MYAHLNVNPHLYLLKALASAAESDAENMKQDMPGVHKLSPGVIEAFRSLLQAVRRDEYGYGLMTVLGQGWRRLMIHEWGRALPWALEPKSAAKFALFIQELVDEKTRQQRVGLLELAGAAGLDTSDTMAYANDEIKAQCRQKLVDSDLLKAA